MYVYRALELADGFDERGTRKDQRAVSNIIFVMSSACLKLHYYTVNVAELITICAHQPVTVEDEVDLQLL